MSRSGSAAVPARVVLLDKPVGPTSFAMVRAARRGTRGRVGHAGTLDPFASGLLLIMTGAATRISSLLMGLPKEYDLLVRFGAVSTTGDPTGEVVPVPEPDGRSKGVTASDVVAALDGFRGRIMQRVPLTSAVKVAGEPLYKRAHRGETVDTPEREVVVYDLSLVEFDQKAQTARLLALTASGTYARVIATGLGQTLGCGAYAAALRRTRVGMFSVDDALSVEELSLEWYEHPGRGVLTLDQALAFLPGWELGEAESRLAANGNELPDAPAGRFRVYGRGRLLGVYEGTAGRARPLVVFPEVA